ncbi:MAG: glycosyltransferase family 2 protein [Bacteroidia bacterium]|nr:glycosyltransferase family 2 protein [Bacteroidia bacterium]
MVDLKGKHKVISILLPAKNEEAYLEECIRSIREQTYAHWELLVIDDNSSDLTWSVANQYSQLDARIRCFKNEGAGVIEALRTGYKHCTGSLITRMDADDLKTPDNLEALLAASGVGIVAVGQVQYFREGGIGEGYARYAKWLNGFADQNNHYDMIYKECVIPSPCWMVYKTDLDKLESFEPNLYPEDYDLCFRFYKAGLIPRATRGIVHLWRDHDARSTRTSDLYRDNRFLDLKLYYFLKLDHNPKQPLLLWGAGRKGKYLANHFREHGVNFRWVTSNPNKIGHLIYDVSLEDSTSLSFDDVAQIVVAVGQPLGQEEIKESLSVYKGQVFWFC